MGCAPGKHHSPPVSALALSRFVHVGHLQDESEICFLILGRCFLNLGRCFLNLGRFFLNLGVCVCVCVCVCVSPDLWRISQDDLPLDFHHVSSAAKLLDKSREVFQVQQALDAKKEGAPSICRIEQIRGFFILARWRSFGSKEIPCL